MGEAGYEEKSWKCILSCIYYYEESKMELFGGSGIGNLFFAPVTAPVVKDRSWRGLFPSVQHAYRSSPEYDLYTDLCGKMSGDPLESVLQ